MIARGDRQHDIAAYFGVNGGRIGEIIAERVSPRHRWVTFRRPAPTWLADARDTLVALRGVIEEALHETDLYEREVEPSEAVER